MRILAIELSSFTGSIALSNDGQINAETKLPDDQRSAQSLIPTIKNLATELDWTIDSLDLVCLTTGPGSFTSLRIGVTAAKVLAWSINADVIAVNTLRATAARAFANDASLDRIVAVMDAQRKQLFAATFQNEVGIPLEVNETAVHDRANLIESFEANTTVTGTGIEKITEQISQSRSDIRIVDRKLWQPQAADVLRVALYDYCNGRRDDRLQLVPQYYRQSAAEEKAGAK